MAYSVVGSDFYKKHRNLDGSDVPPEDRVASSSLHPDSNTDDAFDDNPPFSQEEISWFGMSRFVTGVSTKG